VEHTGWVGIRSGVAVGINAHSCLSVLLTRGFLAPSGRSHPSASETGACRRCGVMLPPRSWDGGLIDQRQHSPTWVAAIALLRSGHPAVEIAQFHRVGPCRRSP